MKDSSAQSETSRPTEMSRVQFGILVFIAVAAPALIALARIYIKG